MERPKQYSNQQPNSTFQPQSNRQSAFDQVNPGRTAMHSSSTPINTEDNTRDRTTHQVKAGDTLWEIAEDKLGSGTRWQELQKKDGSGFTEPEARRLQIGTSVYLPQTNPTNSSQPGFGAKAYTTGVGGNSPGTVQKMGKGGDRSISRLQTNGNQPVPTAFSGAELIKATQSNPQGVSHRELNGGARSEKSPESIISPAAFYETSQGTSPQFQEGVSYQNLANSSPLAQGEPEPEFQEGVSYQNLANSSPLAQGEPGPNGSNDQNSTQNLNGAATYFTGAATEQLAGNSSNTTLSKTARSQANLPDAWAAKQGYQPWSTKWTANGRKQFRTDMNEILNKKLQANPDSPLKAFVEPDPKTGKWKLKREFEAGHMAGATSGTREMFALESQPRNGGKDQSRTIKDPKSGEWITVDDQQLKDDRGSFLRKRAISIDGIPVEIQTARDLEEAGKLPKGTVDNARLHPGWARTAPVKQGEVDQIRNGLYSKQLKNELEDLRKVQTPSPQQQKRLQQLEGIEDRINKGIEKAPSTDALTDPNDQKAVRRLEGMASRTENTPGGKWGGTKVTQKSVDVVRDYLIRNGKLDPKNQKRIDKLRDIAKDPNQRFGKELYAFYDEALRASTADTKNPARGRSVVDGRQNLQAPQPQGGQTSGASDTSNQSRPDHQQSTVSDPDSTPPQSRPGPSTSTKPGSGTPAKPRSTPPKFAKRDPVTGTLVDVSQGTGGGDFNLRDADRGKPDGGNPPEGSDESKGLKPVIKAGKKAPGIFGTIADSVGIGAAFIEDGWKVGEQTLKAAEDAAISAAWTAGGATIGATIGSIVPVLGTGLGAGIGATVGSLIPTVAEYGPKLAKEVVSVAKDTASLAKDIASVAVEHGPELAKDVVVSVAGGDNPVKSLAEAIDSPAVKDDPRLRVAKSAVKLGILPGSSTVKTLKVPDINRWKPVGKVGNAHSKPIKKIESSIQARKWSDTRARRWGE